MYNIDMSLHHELYESYDKEHCWQYDIRQKNESSDYLESGLTKTTIDKMRTGDMVFEYVDKEDKDKCEEIIKFIKKHEWLGKMPNRPTHRFTARYNGILAGVIVMTTPNAFSKLLGDGTKDIEKLISRGACVSWSPKNLGSWIVMKSIKWMITNTNFRVFTAYSDPEAKELGSIYQACSFIYLGKNSGANKQYLDPTNIKIGWVSDRHFRHKGMYKKYAISIGLTAPIWNSYMKKYSPNWDIIPGDITKKIKEELIRYRNTCKVRTAKPKHKYVFIKGHNKGQTNMLLKLFNDNTKRYDYPKIRGE